jgi:hypothetical protein
MIEKNRIREIHVPSHRATRSRLGTRCLAAVASLATWASAAGLGSFTGQWSLDSTRSDRIEQAIESCIASYPEEAKSSTRDRLTETNALVRTLFFSSKGGGEEVLIGYGQAGDGTIAPLDGTEVATTGATGEEMQLTVAWQGEALVERFQAYNGARTNTYTVSSDGGVLSMDVRVESPEMPTVLTYRLVYLRESSSTKKSGRKARYGTGTAERYSLDGRYGTGRIGWRWPTVEDAR